jgi:hypothetical protein
MEYLSRCKICGERHRLGFCPGNEPLPVNCKICGNRHEGLCPQQNKEIAAAMAAREKASRSNAQSASPDGRRPTNPPPVSRKKKPDVEKAKAKTRQDGGVQAVQKAGRKRGRPKKADHTRSLEFQRPWQQAGVSRRTWYRQQNK